MVSMWLEMKAKEKSISFLFKVMKMFYVDCGDWYYINQFPITGTECSQLKGEIYFGSRFQCVQSTIGWLQGRISMVEEHGIMKAHPIATREAEREERSQGQKHTLVGHTPSEPPPQIGLYLLTAHLAVNSLINWSINTCSVPLI